MPTQLTRGAQPQGAHALRQSDGQPMTLAAPAGCTHPQFRRFAACPMHHLHRRNFPSRSGEIADTGYALSHAQGWWGAARGDNAAVLHRTDPEYADVGLGDGTTHLGLPADFLFDPDGTVVGAHYGRRADNQWSVDQLLDINRSPS